MINMWLHEDPLIKSGVFKVYFKTNESKWNKSPIQIFTIIMGQYSLLKMT
jgi:hypothetical protein